MASLEASASRAHPRQRSFGRCSWRDRQSGPVRDPPRCRLSFGRCCRNGLAVQIVSGTPSRAKWLHPRRAKCLRRGWKIERRLNRRRPGKRELQWGRSRTWRYPMLTQTFGRRWFGNCALIRYRPSKKKKKEIKTTEPWIEFVDSPL